MAEVKVWRANRQSVAVFSSAFTQWRIAPNGRRIGLEYASLPFLFDMHEVKAEHRRRVFADVAVMEDAALAYLHDLAKQQQESIGG